MIIFNKSTEITCYIDIVCEMIKECLKIDICGQEVFFLLNCYDITINKDFFGYDYLDMLKNNEAFSYISNNYSSLKNVVGKDHYKKVICFTSTKNLKYNEMYSSANDKIHCIEIINIHDDCLLDIYDRHIRINDKLFKKQIATVEFDDLKEDAHFFLVDLKKLCSLKNRLNDSTYSRAINDYAGINTSFGINTIIKYLEKKLLSIDDIENDNLVKEIQKVYYDIKFNSLIFANVHMKEVICYLKKIDEQKFEQKYIHEVEYNIERLVYHSIKKEVNEIKKCIDNIIKLCKEEKELLTNE